MAAAFAYADGGHERPEELHRLHLIDRFGVEAVMNRKYLGAAELRSMLITENIVEWYRERDKSNLAEWAASNPEKAQALFDARLEAVKRGLIKDDAG